MKQYKYLNEEIMWKRNKILIACLGTEIFIAISELGMFGHSISVPAIISVSVPTSFALRTS